MITSEKMELFHVSNINDVAIYDWQYDDFAFFLLMPCLRLQNIQRALLDVYCVEVGATQTWLLARDSLPPTSQSNPLWRKTHSENPKNPTPLTLQFRPPNGASFSSSPSSFSLTSIWSSTITILNRSSGDPSSSIPAWALPGSPSLLKWSRWRPDMFLGEICLATISTRRVPIRALSKCKLS